MCGKPVLHRTIERFQAAELEADLFLATHADQGEAVRGLADRFDVQVETHNGGIPPWHRLMQIGRKWAVDSWRGGIAGMQAMDERLHPAVLAALAERESADAVIFIPGDAALLVRIEFRFRSDSSMEFEGWFIDNVRVAGVGP